MSSIFIKGEPIDISPNSLEPIKQEIKSHKSNLAVLGNLKSEIPLIEESLNLKIKEERVSSKEGSECLDWDHLDIVKEKTVPKKEVCYNLTQAKEETEDIIKEEMPLIEEDEIKNCSTSVNTKGEKPFECEHCEKKFKAKDNLRRHIMIHLGETPFACEHCDKRFNFKSHLKNHIMIHTGEKPFECKLCEKKFNYKGDLTRHIMIHTGEKPFSCELCEKNFYFGSDLRKHQIIHTGEKPFACEHCDKRFNSKSNLRKHLVIHTGEKPFSCELCEKIFKTKNHLRRHLMIHTGEKPFSCELCEKKFKEKNELRRHQITHTGAAGRSHSHVNFVKKKLITGGI